MKHIFLSLLLVPSFILATYQIDKLEEAIGKCNVRKVKHLLKENTFSPEDKQHLLDLVNGVIEQRRSVLTVLFAPSKENLLIAAGGWIGFISALACANVFNRNFEIIMVPGALSLVAIPVSFIKHFYDYGKLWNNALRIKYLINSIQTTEE